MGNKPYTCIDYRQEMMLAGLMRQLADPHLTAEEKKDLHRQIRRLEKEMGMA
jgi:hypothetical protein